MTGVGLQHYLMLGALLFVCGAVCMATKRNAIGILMGVELVLNGATVNFIAFAHYNPAFEMEGQIFGLFVIVLAAAEAAIALAFVICVSGAVEFFGEHHGVEHAKKRLDELKKDRGKNKDEIEKTEKYLIEHDPEYFDERVKELRKEDLAQKIAEVTRDLKD